MACVSDVQVAPGRQEYSAARSKCKLGTANFAMPLVEPKRFFRNLERVHDYDINFFGKFISETYT